MNLTLYTSELYALLSFWLYVIAYGTLVAIVSFVVWNTKASSKNNWNDIALASNLTTSNLTKYVLMTTFLSMAGLPPFYFFLVKMGVLSFVLKVSNFLTLILMLCFLLFSWYAYQSILMSLLPPMLMTSKFATNQTALWATTGFLTIVLFSLAGLLFVEELYFLCLFFCLK